MSSPQDWIYAFASQAKVDFEGWLRVREDPKVPECHRLLYLQMACEKLCKAYRIAGGTSPSAVQTSHAFVAAPLPQVVAAELTRLNRDARAQRGFMQFVRQLAGEIEALAPAVKRGGKRPDNCGYPWEDGMGKVLSPLNHSFSATGLLSRPEGRSLVLIIQGAIQELLP